MQHWLCNKCMTYECHHCRSTGFILALLSILIRLSLITFILAKFPVEWLNILISGETWELHSLPKGNGNIACLLRLCKAPQISLQQHSLWAAMANVIKCPANTPTPTYHHYYLFADTLILTYTNKHTHLSLPLLFLPDYHSVAVDEGKGVYWSAKVSSHFTWRVCAALLSLKGNCSFHLAALRL